MSTCLNSRGCNNEAVYIEELKSNSFCSTECCLIYKGKMDRPMPVRQKFKDPKRQHTHDLFIWAVTGIDPREPYIPPAPRGVQKGEIRGKYRVKEKVKKIELKSICLGCGKEFIPLSRKQKYHSVACKQQTYRKRKNKSDSERRKIIN